MENKKQRPSAFALAQESVSICAEVTVENVLAARPDWSRAQAIQFLRDRGDEIGNAMAAEGAAILVALTSGGRHGN
jgi:hypothetical protein